MPNMPRSFSEYVDALRVDERWLVAPRFDHILNEPIVMEPRREIRAVLSEPVEPGRYISVLSGTDVRPHRPGMRPTHRVVECRRLGGRQYEVRAVELSPWDRAAGQGRTISMNIDIGAMRGFETLGRAAAMSWERPKPIVDPDFQPTEWCA